MRRKPSLLYLLILFLAPIAVRAQQWSGIIDPSRAIDWSNAGISGGIPNRTTICATVNPSGKTDSTDSTNINNAIASCGTNQVVYLNAGTYTLTNGVLFSNKSNVVLRGAGPTATILKFTGGACTPQGGDVCITNNGYWTGSSQVQPGGSNATSWTAGYAKGTTQITVGSTSGLSVGQVIILDQANDTTDPGPGQFIVCDANVVNGGTCQPSTEQPFSAPGRIINGVNHNEQQFVMITAISGNVLTISPGLYANQWNSAKGPGIWWAGPAITGDGIENLTLDHTNSTSGNSSGFGGIDFNNAFQCWVKNIRSINAQRNHVWLTQSARIEIVDSYFYGVQGGGSLSYGVEMFTASDCLIQNNIFQHVTSPIMTGPSAGCVVAYNYAVDDYYTQADWLTGIAAGHDAGAYLDLFEGNEQPSFGTDLYHGTPENQTIFRNWIAGWQTGKTGNTNAIQLWAYSRLYNVIGNVMGTQGYHTGYEYSPIGSALAPDVAIYVLGYSGGNGQSSTGIPYDPTVGTTLLRWGNYDTVTGAIRWCGNSTFPGGTAWTTICKGVSEIPVGNLVPATINLPSSFYLNSQPAWWSTTWGTPPWPAIGPEVASGPGPGGHAYDIPAAVCYKNSAVDPSYGTSNILAFNAARCYVGSLSNLPAPPTGLTATVN